MKNIKFGLAIPTGTEGLMYPIPYSSARDVVELSVFAEKLGFDSVWGNDHIQTQEYVLDTFGDNPRYYAPLLVLAAIAERTTTLQLCTALLVVPFRHPAIMAKEIATLDHLSNGRVLLGAGLGAYREEFESMFGREAKGVIRGEKLDEGLMLMQRLFHEDCVSYEGKYFSVKELRCFPKPVQDPFPFYIGGNSDHSFGRIAKFGHGWLPAALTTEEIRRGIEKIDACCAQYGRSVKEIDIAPQFSLMLGDTHEEAVRKFKESQLYKHGMSLSESTMKGKDADNIHTRELVGTADEIAGRINDYIEAGVTHFAAITFADNTLEETREHMQRFAEEVMAKFK